MAVIATIAAAYVLLPVAAWGLARALTATLSGVVWLAAAFSSGDDPWTIVRTVLRAAAGTLATPQVSGFIAALVVVSALALFGLQRLLGGEEDSLK